MSLSSWFVKGIQFSIAIVISGCTTVPLQPNDLFCEADFSDRSPAQASPNHALVPQEIYGEEILRLLDGVTAKTGAIRIMHFNWFTDNREDSIPKRVAAKLVEIRKQFPNLTIEVLLESKKDLGEPRGAAERNLVTKRLLQKNGIEVIDIFGRTPPLTGREKGVSHTKLVQVGDFVLAGSTNLTMQSTRPGANNEMNLLINSKELSSSIAKYVESIKRNPGEMVELDARDADLRLLTDTLHFNELRETIRSAVKGDSLLLSMYQFLYRSEQDQQAKEIQDALIEAHRRGVNVEVYLNRAVDGATQNTDANGKVANSLFEAGITRVYLDPIDMISHSKYLIHVGATSRKAIISSVNLYHGDFNNNHQLTWVTKTTSVVDGLISYFRQQVAYEGTRITRFPVDSNGKRNILAEPAPESRMLRFWRGFKQDGVQPEAFRAAVNSKLIPATTEVGARRGLNAYLPSFYSDSKKPFIPHEIAIIDYTSEEKYNGIRTTRAGAAYGPLHFKEGLFTRENAEGFKSSSAVAGPYSGVVAIETAGSAYMFGDLNLNWQSGSVARLTILLKDSTPAVVNDLVANIIETANRSGSRGGVVLVDAQYLIFMMNIQNESSFPVLQKGIEEKLSSRDQRAFEVMDLIAFKNQPSSRTSAPAGGGINVQFNAKLKSSFEAKRTVVDDVRPRGDLALKPVPAMAVEPPVKKQNDLRGSQPARKRASGGACRDNFSP